MSNIQNDVFWQKIRHVFADTFLTGFVLEPDLQIYNTAQWTQRVPKFLCACVSSAIFLASHSQPVI